MIYFVKVYDRKGKLVRELDPMSQEAAHDVALQIVSAHPGWMAIAAKD